MWSIRVFGNVDVTIADLRTRDIDGLMPELVRRLRSSIPNPIVADRIASRIRDRLIVEQEIQRVLVGRETDADHQ